MHITREGTHSIQLYLLNQATYQKVKGILLCRKIMHLHLRFKYISPDILESCSVAEHTPALKHSATYHNKEPGRLTLSLSKILGANPTARENTSE